MFATRMSPEACRDALLAATRPEKMTRLSGWKEAIVRRMSGYRIGVYRERPRVTGIVPNLFWLDVSRATDGALISVTETRTLAAGWWTFWAVGVGLVSLSKVGGGGPPFGWIVAAVGVMQMFWVFVHFVVSLCLADTERRWLASFLENTIAAEQTQAPRGLSG
jgi:hypothetical protein